MPCMHLARDDGEGAAGAVEEVVVGGGEVAPGEDDVGRRGVRGVGESDAGRNRPLRECTLKLGVDEVFW